MRCGRAAETEGTQLEQRIHQTADRRARVGPQAGPPQSNSSGIRTGVVTTLPT